TVTRAGGPIVLSPSSSCPATPEARKVSKTNASPPPSASTSSRAPAAIRRQFVAIDRDIMTGVPNSATGRLAAGRTPRLARREDPGGHPAKRLASGGAAPPRRNAPAELSPFRVRR